MIKKTINFVQLQKINKKIIYLIKKILTYFIL